MSDAHPVDAYETHITVTLDSDERLNALCAWGRARGWKCVYIVLDRGQSPSQPMLTRHGHGPLAHERTVAEATVDALAQAGFRATRVKIESAPWNPDVPRTDTEAPPVTAGQHFESHVKLLLPSDVDAAPLTVIAAEHTARLSRNAFKQREDGFQERFVTQRCYGVGRDEAHRRLEKLLDALRPLGFPVLDVEEEFVIYDSNHSLDAGWINASMSAKLIKITEKHNATR